MPALPRFDLRGLASDALRFARAFPATAASVARVSSDPFTERLVEGVQFLGGTLLDQVHELQGHAYEALSERASPWLRRPTPAATILAFEPPPTGAVDVDPNDTFWSARVDGTPCGFRPITSAHIAALRVVSTTLDPPRSGSQTLRIVFESSGAEPLNRALASGVALYFDDELESALRVAHALTHGADGAMLESADWVEPVPLPSSALRRTGFHLAETLAPDPVGIPHAFGVVGEAFIFPHKFRFVRIEGLERCSGMAATTRAALVVRLREPLPAATTLHARLHCVAAVNLFEAAAEPVALRLERGPVRLRVAGVARRDGGVYAVRKMSAVQREGSADAVPLADLRRLTAARFDPRCPAFYATSVEATTGGDGDAELAVRFGLPKGASLGNREWIASTRVWASNRAAAERVRPGDLEGELARAGQRIRFRNIVAASRYAPPATGIALALKAVRHAAVRRGSGELLASLKESLELSIPSLPTTDDALDGVRAKIASVLSFEVQRARRPAPLGGSLLGYGYRLTLDETAFRGPGEIALFGEALGEALRRALPVNTFAVLTVTGSRTGFSASFPREEQ